MIDDDSDIALATGDVAGDINRLKIASVTFLLVTNNGDPGGDCGGIGGRDSNDGDDNEAVSSREGEG